MFIDYLLIYFSLTEGLFFFSFRERGLERDRQTSTGCLFYEPWSGTAHMSPTKDQNHNPGLCTEWEIEPETFGFTDDAPSELHPPGWVSEFELDPFTSRIWNLASDFCILTSRLSANMITNNSFHSCKFMPTLPLKRGVCTPSSSTQAGPGLILTRRTLWKWCCMTSGLCSFIPLSWDLVTLKRRLIYWMRGNYMKKETPPT